MKLSEKLAILDEEERRETNVPTTSTPSRRRPVNARPRRSDESWDANKRKVLDLVREEIAPRMAGLTGPALATEVKDALDRILQREDVQVSPMERRKFVRELIQDALGYGPLDPLLQDPTITEIMCNSFDDIWVEREGRIHATDGAFTDDVQYRQVIEKIVSAVGRRIDESSPMVDARLPDGSRVNVAIRPVAVDGPLVSIRKFAKRPISMERLVELGALKGP
ncbi:MAG: Flp pilus assembly complex ATPase component TadA, partial [Actinomycetota bacterium]|nr:Flp pilus assembly complex ATPase component TadA [Actinomycetota bacterium]